MKPGNTLNTDDLGQTKEQHHKVRKTPTTPGATNACSEMTLYQFYGCLRTWRCQKHFKIEKISHN